MSKNKNKKGKNNNANVTKKVENEVKNTEKVEETVKENTNVKEEKKVEKKDNKKVQNKKENNDIKKNDDNKKEDVKNEKKIKKEEKQKEAKKAEKDALKKAKKEEKASEEKEIEKKIKKSSNNDTKIVIGIVAAVIIIAFGIFGFYFAKSNLEYCISYDGGTISNADYEVYYKTFATMLQYYGYPESEIPTQIANKAAIDAIIVKMANDANITISEEDEAAIESVFNDKEQLETFASQGIDIARMRKLYYNDYLITSYIEKQVEEATDEEVAEYIKSNSDGEVDMNEYNTAHILFKTNDDSGNAIEETQKASKKATAEQVLQRVKNGEDFATLAKEFSEDTTAENGGKYTCYDDGYTIDEYIKAAKTLKDGEVYATLVETSYGYHIIKMESKVENGRVNNETDREEYVDKKINSLSEEKNVTIDEEKLNKLIESITGKAPATEVEEESAESNSTDTTDDTTSTEGTNTENDTTTSNE